VRPPPLAESRLRLFGSGQASHAHIIFHHGALFQLVFDRERVIWACRLEEFLEVVRRSPRWVFQITLGGYHELLVGVAGVLVFHLLITTRGDHDSLGPSSPCRWLRLMFPNHHSGLPCHCLVRRQLRLPPHWRCAWWLCRGVPSWSSVARVQAHAPRFDRSCRTRTPINVEVAYLGEFMALLGKCRI
jgi:hypothetical protein